LRIGVIIAPMALFVSRLIRRLTGRIGWLLPVFLMLFVLATSWPLMVLAEGADAKIVEPGNYWWWFFITTTTVGYGDFFPLTSGGRLVGGYVIIGGIAAVTTLFTRLSAAIDNARGRRMAGSITLDLTGHVVVLGYTPGRTERIIDEMLADGEREVVLGAWDEVDRHPMPQREVHFVRGDLADDAVLRRASVHKAHSVLIDVRDDNEALAVLVTVAHLTRQAHIVVALRDMEKAPHLSYVHDGVRCVQWVHPRMLTEELQDPGITQVYTDLMTQGGANTYSLRLTAATRFGACQLAMGRSFDATVLAVDCAGRLLVSPPWDTELAAGTVVYYVARRRLTAEQITAALV
jgi:voltage-gated potassium channel